MIAYKSIPPDSAAFINFRAHLGWGTINHELAKTAIAKSLFWVSAYDGEKLVGFGRVIGDQAINFYIQDLIVTSDYQGRGIGKGIMARLMEFLIPHQGATVGLLSVADKEGLYQQFGFQRRPYGRFGSGMSRVI